MCYNLFNAHLFYVFDYRAVGVPAGSEGESLPRHAAHGGGAGRGRRAPARPAALSPARRAGRTRPPLARPI